MLVMYTGRRVGRLVSSSLKASLIETRITCLAHFQLESKNLTKILIKLLINTFFSVWPSCWNVFNPLRTNPIKWWNTQSNSLAAEISEIRNITLVRTFVLIICQTNKKYKHNGLQRQILMFLQRHLLPYQLQYVKCGKFNPQWLSPCS